MENAIIFDMDGVLFDTETLGIQIAKETGAQMGYSITEEMMHKVLGRDVKQEQQVFQTHLGEDFDYGEYRARYEQLLCRTVETDGMPQKPGLFALLDALKEKHYKIAVATSTHADRAMEFLKLGGVYPYLDAAVYGDMITHGKPEPDIYLCAAQKLRAEPEQCFVVEDSFAGVTAAYRAGMKPVMVPDILQPDEPLKRLLFACCKSLSDVIALI
jgi:HAD superfamily hydrolase (TIGR01509 family)